MPLKISNLKFYYHQDQPIFENIDFLLGDQGCYSLVGASGSGKTTLLRCIAQIIEQYQGDVFYNDINLAKLSPIERVQTIGYVAQQYHLFQHMTVLENCIHPQRHVLKKSKEEANKTTLYYLEQLDVASLAHKLPHQLSGGQQQRVAMARALCMGSKMLCLDEPTAALDPNSKEKLKQVFIKLKSMGHTILMSTHDIEFAKDVSDRVIPLDSITNRDTH